MEFKKSVNLLQELINCSEKASNIARLCRSNENLLSLLVQEKTGDDANARFQQDFKTLADVLIQETIKHDIGILYPAMRDAIKGEESPNFTNKDGVSASIEIGETVKETAHSLTAIMQDNDAANALAAEVHRKIEYDGEELGELPNMPENLDFASLGIWIDPIDATAEYISGSNKMTDYPDIAASGLHCVTVLIGVYNRDTGLPVIGVISQPFFEQVNPGGDSFKSRVYWGVALPQLKSHNCTLDTSAKRKSLPLIICSSSEKTTILNKMREIGFEIVSSAGAGHKALKVITNNADVYLLSKSSTFKWDTCAPQAILRALDGDVLDFNETVKQQIPISLKYLDTKKGDTKDDDLKCNSGGIIVIRDLNLLHTFLSKLV